MAEYWADSKAAPGGNGLTIDTPFNTIPSNTFGNLHTWNLKYGSVFDFGLDQLTSGNNALVRAYGDPTELNPLLKGRHASFFSCATASGTVVFENISFIRDGASAGAGITCQQMTNVLSSFTLRGCMVAGFNENIKANRTYKLVVEGCDILGNGSSYGIRGQAFSGFNANGWSIVGNTFNCATDLELYVSDDAGTLGSFNDLVIEDNNMVFGGMSGGTSLMLRAKANATDYAATASITGGNTLVRDPASPVWPNWSTGTVIFLAGWMNAANFGTVTVVSGGGTRSVVVTNLGATLVNESTGIGKGAGIRDPLRAFNNPIIRRNKIRNRGYTPVFIDNFIGGVLEQNDIDDTVAVGSVAAAIEAFNCLGTVAKYNRIRGITGFVTVDGMGIFWDGACENCLAFGNYFSNLRVTSNSPYDNFGHAMALFFCKNCGFESNIVDDCRKGLSASGVATTGYGHNNTINNCGIGYSGSSNLPIAGVSFKSNVVQNCAVGISDQGSSVVSKNSWWQNLVDHTQGTLAAKDALAITADPLLDSEFRMMSGSPLKGVGLQLGVKRDFSGYRRPSLPSVGACDSPRLLYTV